MKFNLRGVAVIVKREITHELLHIPKTRIIETFGIKIKLSDNNYIHIFTAYLPPAMLKYHNTTMMISEN